MPCRRATWWRWLSVRARCFRGQRALARVRRPATHRNGHGLRRRCQQTIERLAEPVDDYANGAANALSEGWRGAITTGISWAIM